MVAAIRLSRSAIFLLPLLCLAACGDSAGSRRAAANAGADPALVSPDVPSSPAAGSTRAGTIYAVTIPSPLGGGETIAATVMEPTMLTGGAKYPLVVHSHGFGQSKQSAGGAGGVLMDGTQRLLDAGYGVISFDERGHGDSGGQITVMDPDHEGQNVIRVFDWAEANLDWLLYRSGNLVVGSMGQSYGGGWQLMMNSIDPKQRLDALAPRITWYDLRFSLNPGGVIKSGWVGILFGAGTGAGDGGNFDPYVNSTLQNGVATNTIADESLDYFGYHSNRYFCEGLGFATNGGPGTQPAYASKLPPKVDALFFQGMRDSLFNFSEATANYECLRARGGDVRLFSYQSGHNSLQAVPDPGEAFQPPNSAIDNACGPFDADEAIKLFFDEKLKGITGAADAIGHEVCLSLGAGDAVRLPSVTKGKVGPELAVPATTLLAGIGALPVAADLGIVAGPAGDVFGGIPEVELELADATGASAGAGSDAIVFVGVGHQRAILPGVWDLMDNQLLPLRGLGSHKVPLIGVAERLAPGDKIGLVFYGASPQFPITGSAHPMSHFTFPVTITGKAWMPLLGNLPSATAP